MKRTETEKSVTRISDALRAVPHFQELVTECRKDERSYRLSRLSYNERARMPALSISSNLLACYWLGQYITGKHPAASVGDFFDLKRCAFMAAAIVASHRFEVLHSLGASGTTPEYIAGLDLSTLSTGA